MTQEAEVSRAGGCMHTGEFVQLITALEQVLTAAQTLCTSPASLLPAARVLLCHRRLRSKPKPSAVLTQTMTTFFKVVDGLRGLPVQGIRI